MPRDWSRLCYRFVTGTPLQVPVHKSTQHWQPAIPRALNRHQSSIQKLVALRVKVLRSTTHNLASLRALRAASVTGGQVGRTPAGGRPGRSLTPSDSDSDAVSRLTQQKAGLTCRGRGACQELCQWHHHDR
jgi:hypothetical protein